MQSISQFTVVFLALLFLLCFDIVYTCPTKMKGFYFQETCLLQYLFSLYPFVWLLVQDVWCFMARFVQIIFFQLSAFVSSAWSFGFFIPATTANDLQLRRIAYPRFFQNIYFPILFLEKEPVFPFSMLSAKQVNYWYHFYNVFGMTQSLTGD